MSDDDFQREVAYKVVSIIQTIAEDMDDSGKKAWLKMLGLRKSSKEPPSEESESHEGHFD